jgi:uncharacterized protein with HEPN domain
MPKDDLIYIEHIRDSIKRILEYTANLQLDDFLGQTLIQDAVIRNLEIIGEATKQLSGDFKDKYPDIEWRKIAGMRDKLIHDYIGVDIWAVWAVVEKVLPEFRLKIENILKEEM